MSKRWFAGCALTILLATFLLGTAEPERFTATFSIVAYDPPTAHLGVAPASKFPAAGAMGPHARARAAAGGRGPPPRPRGRLDGEGLLPLCRAHRGRELLGAGEHPHRARGPGGDVRGLRERPRDAGGTPDGGGRGGGRRPGGPPPAGVGPPAPGPPRGRG